MELWRQPNADECDLQRQLGDLWRRDVELQGQPNGTSAAGLHCKREVPLGSAMSAVVDELEAKIRTLSQDDRLELIRTLIAEL